MNWERIGTNAAWVFIGMCVVVLAVNIWQAFNVINWPYSILASVSLATAMVILIVVMVTRK
jgi:hypothetical protein